MLEFASAREVYEQTFNEPPDDALRDQSPRLALEDIINQALLNSREYQAAKEQLYRAALELTLQRDDYALKFTPFGNGTDVDYRHNRVAGITVNDLDVNTRFAGDKALSTGGKQKISFFKGDDAGTHIGSHTVHDFSGAAQSVGVVQTWNQCHEMLLTSDDNPNSIIVMDTEVGATKAELTMRRQQKNWKLQVDSILPQQKFEQYKVWILR